MSYVLQIWAFPAPPSVAAVDGILAELAQRPKKPQTQFLELARRLTARHPCITTLDEDDENAVWTDGPMDGRTDEPLWGVGVLSQHLDTVVPFVVETATAMGFVVYDDQAGECHLPGGMSLLPDGRRVVGHHLGQPVPERLEAAVMERFLMQSLESAVALNGFRFEPATGLTTRTSGEWTQTLAVQVQPPDPAASGAAALDWRCDIEMTWSHSKMARMWSELDRAAVLSGGGPAQRYRGTAGTTFSRMAWFGRREWPLLAVRRADTTWVLRDSDGLRTLAVSLRELAGTAMVELIQVVNSVEQLAQWCLSENSQTWRPFPLLVTTPTGLDKRTVQRRLIDTDACGGPVTLLMLGGLSRYPEMPALLARCQGWARELGSATELRLELAARALREGGLMPPD